MSGSAVTKTDKHAMDKIKSAKEVADKVSVKSHKKELKVAIKSIKKSLSNKPVENFLSRGFSRFGSFLSDKYQKTKKYFGKKGGEKRGTRKNRGKRGGGHSQPLGYAEYGVSDSSITDLPKSDKQLSDNISTKQ